MAELCLLCSAPCPTGVPPGEVVLDIPGACGNPSLGRQLEQMFILRRVLGMDLVCAKDLLRGGGGQGEWLQCCADCMRGRVQEMWGVFREIVELTWKLRGMREEVREGIRQQILRGERGEGTCNWQIRKRLFPDLFVNVGDEVEYPVDIEYKFNGPPTPADAKESLEHHEHDPPEEDEEEDSSDPNFESEGSPGRLKILQEIPPPKRKRGRPPKPAHLKKKSVDRDAPKRKVGRPPLPTHLKKSPADPDTPKRKIGRPPKPANLIKKMKIDVDAPKRKTDIENQAPEAPSSPAAPLEHQDDLDEEEQDSKDPEAKHRRLKSGRPRKTLEPPLPKGGRDEGDLQRPKILKAHPRPKKINESEEAEVKIGN